MEKVPLRPRTQQDLNETMWREFISSSGEMKQAYDRKDYDTLLVNLYRAGGKRIFDVNSFKESKDITANHFKAAELATLICHFRALASNGPLRVYPSDSVGSSYPSRMRSLSKLSNRGVLDSSEDPSSEESSGDSPSNSESVERKSSSKKNNSLSESPKTLSGGSLKSRSGSKSPNAHFENYSLNRPNSERSEPESHSGD